MQDKPSFNVIIPVWNNPTAARCCIVSVLDSTDSAQLTIVNNGCDRETGLMLEEFCDHLGERAVYMTMERNIGFVPAVNRALNRSETDWALILSPTGSISRSCYAEISAAADSDQAGIITPHCMTELAISRQTKQHGCKIIESCDLSFATLAVARGMREKIGHFDEGMDSGIFCLKDYRHRADSHGYRTVLLPSATVLTDQTIRLGSVERWQRVEAASRELFHQRWGVQQHCAVYLPKETDEQQLNNCLSLLLAVARRGHRVELFLHRQQHHGAIQRGAACLHNNITLHKLPLLMPQKGLAAAIERLKGDSPQLLLISGLPGCRFPGFPLAEPSGRLQQLAMHRNGGEDAEIHP